MTRAYRRAQDQRQCTADPYGCWKRSYAGGCKTHHITHTGRHEIVHDAHQCRCNAGLLTCIGHGQCGKVAKDQTQRTDCECEQAAIDL